MIAKILPKPQTQRIIKDLRRAGYEVTKSASGLYECKTESGKTLFAAMPGSRGYLVRYDGELLREA